MNNRRISTPSEARRGGTNVGRLMHACWHDERVCHVGLDGRGVEHVEVIVELAKLGGEGTLTSTGMVSCIAIEDVGDPEGLASSLVLECVQPELHSAKQPRGKHAPAPAAASVLRSRRWSKTNRSKANASSARESELCVTTPSNKEERS